MEVNRILALPQARNWRHVKLAVDWVCPCCGVVASGLRTCHTAYIGLLLSSATLMPLASGNFAPGRYSVTNWPQRESPATRNSTVGSHQLKSLRNK